MAINPAFLLYSQDFLIGCAEFTHEEIGQYFRILCYMHQKGRMKGKTISLLVGSVLDNVRLKFDVDNEGNWYNEKLELVIEERRKFVESRKINGSLGGRPKIKKPIAPPNEIEDEIVIVNEISSLVVNKRKDQILEYCRVQGYAISEGESFYDHYQALGWRTSAGMGIVDWKAKMRTWHKEQIKRDEKNGTQGSVRKGATGDELASIATERAIRNKG